MSIAQKRFSQQAVLAADEYRRANASALASSLRGLATGGRVTTPLADVQGLGPSTNVTQADVLHDKIL